MTDLNNREDFLQCPACGGVKLEKYGKTPAGVQKYKCLKADCRRQFVAGSDHLIKPEIKSLILRLIDKDVHPRTIYQSVNDQESGQPKISLRWIYKLKRRIKNDRFPK